jgi:hypothetical protein
MLISVLFRSVVKKWCLISAEMETVIKKWPLKPEFNILCTKETSLYKYTYAHMNMQAYKHKHRKLGRWVSIATGYAVNGWGSIPSRSKIFFSFQNIQMGSEAHPASYPMAASDPIPGVKWLGCDFDLSLPSNAVVNNGGAITLPYVSLAWCFLPEDLSPGISGWGVKLPTCFHLMLRSIMVELSLCRLSSWHSV